MTTPDDDARWIGHALEAVAGAAAAGEVPVGAVVVHADGRVLATAANRTVRDRDPTAHAEVLALRAAAAAVGEWRLSGCTLYVTLEPCAMCAGALVLARVDRVVFGAWDDKAGMAGSVGDVLRHPRLNHRPSVRGGVREAECGALLTTFFRARRGAAQSVDTPPAAG
ncbi:tRNA adenosine(34) deaminase TadA [Roseisolibacter sp. H3M3-2]|uniref:tRNA adenosine(34) deaminase TadA n=1 Tax=Roseisolibacter sp. H3M3-2 TaxID=3031323 RepID=UPI0023DACEA0|nr:tRNA adenosine(34) deaminase TadA [Roseisolibacter sp. H3M3-2]MDF1502255.1 tRNA adenosine(34) deaminase TadA [Roseisolibacter sp. H3M3-2]